jgi:hypothetical protein
LASWPTEQEAAVSGLLSLKEAGTESSRGYVDVNTNALTGEIDVDETRSTSFEISSNKLNGVDGNLFNDVISSDFNGPCFFVVIRANTRVDG